MFEYACVCMCVCVFEHRSENLNNFFKCCSNGLLPKTNVIGFRMTNNFCVQSFSSYYTKMEETFEFRSVHDIFKCTKVSNFIFQTVAQMNFFLK